MSSRTVCVTGGAGFIGSPLAGTLPPPRPPEAAALMREAGIEVLVHHAAQMDVRRSVADPVHDASVNVVGTLNLLEAGRSAALRQVIFASTGGAMYGEQTA